MTSIPFNIDYNLGGLAVCSGLLKLETDSILVELQSRDSFIGIIKSKIRKVEIPLEKIESITFKKSLFGARISLRVSDLEIHSSISASSSGELLFRLYKKHAHDAAELVTAVELGIADQKFKRIEEYFSG